MYNIRSHVRVLGGSIKLLNIKDLIGLWEYSSRLSDDLIWHSNDHSCIPGSQMALDHDALRRPEGTVKLSYGPMRFSEYLMNAYIKALRCPNIYLLSEGHIMS